MNNQLAYEGSIRVYKYKRGRLVKTFKRHNRGTVALFTLLCNALRGQLGSADRPSTIDIGITDGDDSFSSVLGVAPSISIGAVVVDNENDSSSITFSASLTNANSGEGIQSGRLYYALRSGTGSVLATSFTGMTSTFTIAIDEIYLIQWTLTFSNAASDSTTSGGD